MSRWNMIAWVTPELFVMVGGEGEGGGMLRLYDRRKGWLCDAQGEDWMSEDARDNWESGWSGEMKFAHSGEVDVVVTSGRRIATSSACWTRCGNPHSDTLKVWEVKVGEGGQEKLVHVASAQTEDDEAQVSNMAVSEGVLATIWR